MICDLDAASSLPGDDVGVIVRRYIEETFAFRVLARVQLRIEPVRTEKSHVAPVAANRLDLCFGRLFGNENYAGYIERTHGVGDGCAMIATRCGRNAAGALPGREAQQAIGRTAQLE